jgi:hypothetical protein
MSGQVTITQLPVAGALAGTESVPIVQNGVTVQTTTGAIAGAGALNYPFLTVGSTAGLTQARYIATGSGLSVTDNGAGNTLQINLIGAAQSLDGAGTGIIVKTGTTTVTNRLLTVGAGMTIANADGIADNPSFGLSTNLQNLSSLSGNGILAINGTTFTPFTLQGTTNQISIANGNAVGGSPTISIYPNPILPGTGSVTVPLGTTAQRTGSNGALRYNTDTATLEAYANNAWGAIVSGSGVTTFSAGTTGFTPNTPTAGGIILGGTLIPANGGTGAVTLTGYVYGNGTSPMTASTTIPTTALSGTITNAQLANSSLSFNGVTVALGASGTITAVNPYTLTFGTHLTGTSYNGSAAVTIGTDATNANTVSTIVARDASGNFSAGTITATLNGTATQVSNALTFGSSLSGTSSTYNGSAAVTVNVANSGVTAGTYGSSAVIPVITVGADGRVTSVSTQSTNAPAYQGTWNANTNTPTLTSSVGTQGFYYVVSVAGNTNLNGNAVWSVGDWAIFANGAWDRIPGSTSESFTSLTTTNLAVTGLTGYMYANGSGNVTASTTIPNAGLANSTISGVSLGSNLFNLTAGTNITFSSGTTYNGSSAITINAASTMVYPGAGIPNSTGSAWGTSYSTTGSGTVVALATSPTFVTPILGTPQSGNFSTGTFTWPTFNQNTTGNASTATTANNLSGTTQYSLPYQSASATTGYLSPGTANSVLITNGVGSAPTWSNISSLAITSVLGTTNQITTSTTTGVVTLSLPTSITTGQHIANQPISGSATQGAFAYGTLNGSDTGIFASYQTSIAGYAYMALQNTSSNAAATTDIALYNDTASLSKYIDIGINSSAFTGTGNFSLANAGYIYTNGGDLVLGTYSSNGIHFIINNGATDAVTINTSGAIAVNGSYGTTGQVMISQGSSASPTWGAVAGGGF